MTLNAPTPTPVVGLLALWSGRHPTEFPSDAPPCDRIGDSASDRVLAAAFQSLALDTDEVHRLVSLSRLIKLHTDRTNGALLAQPQRYDELRQWLRMILVLSTWFMALHNARVEA